MIRALSLSVAIVFPMLSTLSVGDRSSGQMKTRLLTASRRSLLPNVVPARPPSPHRAAISPGPHRG